MRTVPKYPEGLRRNRGWRRWLSYRALLICLPVLVTVVCVFSVLNANGLRRAVEQSTKGYVGDVAFQMARDIDARIEDVMVDLEMLTDSLVRIDTQEARLDFLRRKAEQLGFTQLAMSDRNGHAICTEGPVRDFKGQDGFEASLAGGRGVSFDVDQRILYSVPIWYEDEIAGVLVGERNKSNMQALIQTDGFGGNGVSCIIDRAGEVIVSPTDLNIFFALDDIFVKDADPVLAQAVAQMLADMQAGKDGVIAFTTVDGSDVRMSYNALHTFDWVLLTLVPADIISHDTDIYIRQTFALSLAFILLCSLGAAAMYFIYSDHRRQLERVAFVDPVTGGMNGTRFLLACRRAMDGAPAGTYTVVSLNLRDFRLINDAFGMERGNETLRHILKAMERCVADGEFAARSEADRFVLCLRESSPGAVCARLSDIRAAVNAFNAQREEPYPLVLSAGAYLVDDLQMDVTAMIDRAGIACRTQASDDGCVFYDAALTERMQYEKQLVNLLPASLRNRDFEVYLQPKVGLRDGRVRGAEALVRWHHPQKGVIYPSDFIPVFEKNGDICKLDLYVFEEVCARLAQRIEKGAPVLPVSVNLSRRHFHTRDFLHRFADIRDRYGIPNGLLEFELTESVFFTDGDIIFAQQIIHNMHELGFACSLDDFGAGFSSLGLIKSFAVDTVKLDRCFFLEYTPRAKDVVTAIVALTHKLGITTVAEGIEEEQQLAFLREIGCDMVQGYVYARPMPAAEFEAWMQDRAGQLC